MSLKDKILKDRGTSGTGSEKKKVIITAATPEEEAIRQQKATAQTNTVVPQEEYDALMELYRKGEAEDKKNPGKISKETLEFQRRYHANPALKQEAEKILSNDPKKTKWAESQSKTQYDVTGNEDGIFGRRTRQYMEALQRHKPEAAKTPETKIVPTPPLADEAQTRAPIDDQLIYSHGNPEAERALPPIEPQWWLQDKFNALNAGLNVLKVRPYYPWEPTINLQTARANYLSPERALAENQSQMNMQLGMLRAFNTPQALNARASEITGRGFANAANTIADVHNRNVAIANKFNQDEAATRNQETIANAAHATSLWDKYQATRQNFDTEKKKAFDNLTNVVNQAITNRANTYNLNQMNPQFAVNPGQGGTMFFHDPRALKGSQSPTAIGDAFAAKLADPRFKAIANTPQGQGILWSMTQKEYGMPDDAMAQYAQNRNIPNQQVPVPGYNQQG